MNNIFIYCEVENGRAIDVSLELLTKGRKLADELKCDLEAVALGSDLNGIEQQLFPYGADIIHLADNKKLYPYLTLPHASIVSELFKKEKPQIVLFGATSIGRDIAPRIASALKCGLTADCTSLNIGDYNDKREGKEYKNLLYQLRPAFGGNIIGTIVCPEAHPQMATVREGVMKKEIVSKAYKGTVKKIDTKHFLSDENFVIKIIERHIEKKKIDIKNSSVIVSGGYGVGSKDTFKLLFELADVLGGEVGCTRAAVDAGYVESDRQIGQTGVTVRPKLYIACGISGAVQHTAGMQEAAMIISINNDKNAPINQLADYSIVGDVKEIIPKMIKYYKKHAK